MKSIVTKIAATVATSAALSVAIAVDAPKAEAASYNLSWTGDSGFTAEGMFSFDDSFLGGLVTATELDDFMISFLDPAGMELATFDYDFPAPDTSGEFNFNFDSATGNILQLGSFDTSDGFDLGTDFDNGDLGIDFYTSDGDEGFPSVGTIILDNNLTPMGCGAGTNALPSDCETLDIGGELVATQKSVPEPASILGLLTVGALGATSALKKKQASS
ncbi:PEP-CTERM sorting domain-containing protein [Coleofasciculus sp. E2-BRE-01]|uniref:PEP-CTERM sorting domain-containing protein n=1 Tax=Coleofasciculus sp. E2-BRE-01 TaxID=3069524 RepID=UPI0032FEDED2